MADNFFKQMKEDLFPHPDKFLDVETGRVFNNIGDILKFRREHYTLGGPERGAMRVLRRGPNDGEWK